MDKKEAKRILSDAKAVLTQYIESRGLRKTQERYAILEAVYGFNEPFSIEDLSNALMEKCQVTLPTLYRTLDLFITLGLVIRHTQKDVQHYEKCYGRFEVPSLPSCQCHSMRVWQLCSLQFSTGTRAEED